MNAMDKRRAAMVAKKVLLDKRKSKKAIVAEFNKRKAVEYPHEGELHERILQLIYEYDGEISNVSVLGVLDLVSESIRKEAVEVG